MKTVTMRVDELVPYAGNAKEHPDWQIGQIAESIKQFGFNDPVGIWHNGAGEPVIVEGHGRVLAAEELGLESVHCIVLDHMDDEARRAYTLVHNQLTTNTGYDERILAAELGAIEGISMDDFGFADAAEMMSDIERRHDEYVEDTIERAVGILNTHKAIFRGEGLYDIPMMLPFNEDVEIDEWIPFNYVMSDKNPSKRKGVHFFIDDYQFERIWNNTDAYIDKLKQYGLVIAPDFTPMTSYPMATQIWNHYRKHWVARYLQEAGVNVIPCIRSTGDEYSLEWFLDGVPRNATVCMSSQWAHIEDERESIEREYKIVREKLEPSRVYVYGKRLESFADDVIEIKTFGDEIVDRKSEANRK